MAGALVGVATAVGDVGGVRRLADEAPFGVVGVAGTGSGPLDDAMPGSGVPHWLQKRAPGGLVAPQLAQRRGSGCPHWMQKRALAAFSVEQLGHTMRTLLQGLVAHLQTCGAHWHILACRA
jgi:hypothetical protein